MQLDHLSRDFLKHPQLKFEVALGSSGLPFVGPCGQTSGKNMFFFSPPSVGAFGKQDLSAFPLVKDSTLWQFAIQEWPTCRSEQPKTLFQRISQFEPFMVGTGDT